MARIEKYIEVRVPWGGRPELKVGEIQIIEKDGEVEAVDFFCPAGAARAAFSTS